jgi:ABC-type nickel/cobalt efflux system permease component RcnA
MRLAAIILLLISMWTFSIGVNNFNAYEPEGDESSAQSEKLQYAVGSFAIPAITLVGAWFCWRKSLQTPSAPTQSDPSDS